MKEFFARLHGSDVARWVIPWVMTSRTAFVASRYVAAVAVAAEALLLARLLGPDRYGYYAILAQLAVLLTFVTAGSNAGYVYAYYKQTDPALDRSYLACLVQQILIGAALLSIGLLIYRPFFAVAVVLFLLQTPYVMSEPMLRVRKYFVVTAVGKALPAVFTLLIVGGWIAWIEMSGGTPSDLTLTAAIGAMLIGNFAGNAVYCVIVARCLGIVWRNIVEDLGQRRTWAAYWRLVLRPGLPLNASTLIIAVLMNVDRLFIEHFRSAGALSVYSLGWQLSQGVMLLLTSMNLVSGVRIGECVAGTPELLLAEVRRQFRLTALACAVVFGGLVTIAWTLSVTFYRDYENLVLVTCLLSVGYMWMNLVGSITGVLFYQRRSALINTGYLVVLAASIIGNLVAVQLGLWYGAAIAITSVALICLNTWFGLYIRYVALRPTFGRPAHPVVTGHVPAGTAQ